MTSLKKQLTHRIKTAIEAIYGLNIDPMIQSTRAEYGDYQANFALRLAKQLQQKPLDIAEAVITQLKTDPIFAKLEASGPGFINITLTDTFLSTYLSTLLPEERLGVSIKTDNDTIVVDYGGANVAKEMHVGHLRSAIIGDAIVRLLSFVGYRVIRQNHLGDWGTQFGMLVEYIVDSNWQAQPSHSLSELNSLYRLAKQRFDSEPDFADRARARLVALQSGDRETLAIWQKLVNESKYHFQKVYEQLGVLLQESDMCGESFYNDRLSALTTELEQQNIAVQDDGALVIFLEGFLDPNGQPLPLLIRKRDGGFLYATTDFAAIEYRLHSLKAKRIIYVVDARQKQHFAMLFAAANKAGWMSGDIQLEHVPNGAVLGEDHKPFKTRSGEVVKLKELLDEAEKRAQEIVSQKNPTLSVEELSHIAKTIGIGALKYADLRSDKVKNYVFSWEKMLAFDGNTGPYLQNAYVRICAIFRKGNVDRNAIQQSPILIGQPVEHALAIKITEFPDVIDSIIGNLNLHSLCDYLYDLASTFHHFYEHCPVLTDADEKIRSSRLLLCDLTARTLKLGLSLLGIGVLEKM